eukprot:m.272620 g.272620  ORF g.272620 m.272620 type:complete len:175 (-) comp102467_c0_seq1:234-758(-)
MLPLGLQLAPFKRAVLRKHNLLLATDIALGTVLFLCYPLVYWYRTFFFGAISGFLDRSAKITIAKALGRLFVPSVPGELYITIFKTQFSTGVISVPSNTDNAIAQHTTTEVKAGDDVPIMSTRRFSNTLLFKQTLIPVIGRCHQPRASAMQSTSLSQRRLRKLPTLFIRRSRSL